MMVVLCAVMFSCTDDEGSSLLQEAPYAELTDSIQDFPGRADLYYKRGVLLYERNQRGLAAEDLHSAWTMDPQESYALSMTTVLKEKSPDSAIAFLKNAIQKLPNSIALKVGLARGYQQKNLLQEAIAVCDEILQQYPAQLDALSLKAQILGQQNKPSEALAQLEKAYSVAPFDPEISYDLAYEYAVSKNPKAIPLSDSLIRSDKTRPGSIAKAYYTKGIYYTNTSKPAEAIRHFDEAIRTDYNFMDAYLDKGQLLYNQKRYDEALRTFSLALRIDPSVPEFYFWNGKVYEAKGMMNEAKQNYSKAAGLDKEFAEAREALERVGG
jgi:tetratricopeptide (TPR) repeat protein